MRSPYITTVDMAKVRIAVRENSSAEGPAYITALKSKHIEHGINTSVFDDSHLKRMLQEALRLCDPKRSEREEKSPVLSYSKWYILSVLTDTTNRHDANLIADFTVAFLMPSEFIWSS